MFSKLLLKVFLSPFCRWENQGLEVKYFAQGHRANKVWYLNLELSDSKAHALEKSRNQPLFSFLICEMGHEGILTGTSNTCWVPVTQPLTWPAAHSVEENSLPGQKIFVGLNV